jgi:hypothetical protein
MIENLEELFCLVDDFCQEYMPLWNQHLLRSGLKKRNKPSRLAASEIMTIFIGFHQMRFRDFKTYYRFVQRFLVPYFPGLVSYTRFVTLLKSILVPLLCFMRSFTGEKTGIYFVDSTILRVCHIKREHQHRVFRGIAKQSKSTLGWFFGFKLHLVINDKGELMAVQLTAGNVDDRVPVPQLTKSLTGKLFGDKGYISQPLFDSLLSQGLQLVTRIKKNMKNKLMPLVDKLLLRKRGIIESVNNQLKNISQIEHTRHRSIWNFAVNILGALTAYILQPKHPSLNLRAGLWA